MDCQQYLVAKMATRILLVVFALYVSGCVAQDMTPAFFWSNYQYANIILLLNFNKWWFIRYFSGRNSYISRSLDQANLSDLVKSFASVEVFTEIRPLHHFLVFSFNIFVSGFLL